MISANSLTPKWQNMRRREGKKRSCRRNSSTSKAEVMLIMILFHDSGYRCLKRFYFLLRKRAVIETANDELKNIAQVGAIRAQVL